MRGVEPIESGWPPGAREDDAVEGAGEGAVSSLRESRMRLHTLISIRWIAIAGQTAAVIMVRYGFGFEFPVVLAGLIIGASILINILLVARHTPAKRLTDRETSLQLAFDLVQLAVLLYLTGGLANPFAVLILVPVTISATTLCGRSTVRLAVLAIAAIVVLGWIHLPLPWIGNFQLAPTYMLGMGSALVLGTVFMSVYASRVAREDRHMAKALTATQLALARERKLSALGGLAAAAAHELGTPLSTIALAASELSREIAPGDAHAEDIELIVTQSGRCREILARLVSDPSRVGRFPFDRLPITALIAEAAKPHQGFGITVDTVIQSAPDSDEPVVSHSPEIIHGLGNLIENAVGYAEAAVEIVVSWDEDGISVGVYDDGPGFDTAILGSLGEPYIRSRETAERDRENAEQGGLGLGVFIAKTLLEHTSADIIFTNKEAKGAAAIVSWPRRALEKEASNKMPGAGQPIDVANKPRASANG